MMWVAKIGAAFFLVGIIVIYVQSFVDMTDKAEAKYSRRKRGRRKYPTKTRSLDNAWISLPPSRAETCFSFYPLTEAFIRNRRKPSRLNGVS